MTFASASFAPSFDAIGPASVLAPRMNRRILIVVAVLAFHVIGLWALQTGLLRRAVERMVPVELLAEFIEPPQPLIPPQPVVPQAKPQPVTKPQVQEKPRPKPTPQPLAIPDPSPAPNAPLGAIAPPAPEPLRAAPVDAAPPAPPAPPSPPKIELPSSSASYLNNAPPAYPPLSKRLGEQGKVVVRALIEANGTASQASIQTSSGYERLDQTALQTVLKWRYVPGKRAGVAEAMWFNIPLNFVLE